MKRKNYTKRQIVGFWEAGEGKCWRCEKKIEGKPTPIYGVDWVLGHVGKAHWCGGVKVAPEHTSCNSEDGKEQTKVAAKSVRIRARDIGVEKDRTGKLSRKMNGDVCRWNPLSKKYDILVYSRKEPNCGEGS